MGFESDEYGLADISGVVDRRMGKER